MHTQELVPVKPGWFRYLESRGALRQEGTMPPNRDQSFTARTLGAMIVIAFAIGVACAAGVFLVADLWEGWHWR